MSHDTLVRRLAMMLVKLNQGASLEPRELADEFGVNLRTIQRDLNERFGYLPLEKHGGKYRMSAAFLGRLTLKDVERFAALAGVGGLFPSLSTEFLRDLFDSRIESSLLVKGHYYEDLSGREAVFKLLEQAIAARRCVRFTYPGVNGTKSVHAQPHRLVNIKGIWYLAAKQDGQLKTYSFARMNDVQLAAERFERDAALLRRIEIDDGAWMSDTPIEVVLVVSKDAAPFFQRRKLIANQVIEKQLEDGGLIVATKVGHLNQVLPLVRYWIPHIRIISPDGLQRQLESDLADYLSGRHVLAATRQHSPGDKPARRTERT
ncbi:MAG: WYL domain-containing protein [Burkholderiales bacterium]|nr:WYL domain-containing protein [Burkholderiales bacterium]